MKIINFISGNDLGGPKQSFLLYSELFKELGHTNVSVIRKGAKLKKLLDSNHLNVKELSYFRTLFPLISHYSIQKIKTLFISLNPDIIFVHKQIDIELVHRAILNNFTIIGIIHGFNAKHIDHANALIAVSYKIKDFLIKNGYKKPIYVIPNMIKNHTEPIFRELPKSPLIGSMGIFRRKKGHHILIEALGILKKRGIQFRGIIAGEGLRKPILYRLKKKYNVENELEIRGWVTNSERETYVDKIDIFVLPSRTESFGMVVAEAMGRKKLVVATKCGGPEEIIVDGKSGFLVEKENPKALAIVLEEIITKKEGLLEIQYNAYSSAMQKYDINSIKNMITAILNDISLR